MASPVPSLRQRLSPHLDVRSVYLRLLGLVFLLAFWSLHQQAMGLFGSQGIWPIRDLMAAVHENGRLHVFDLPSLFWLGSSDGFIRGLEGAGLGLSALLIAGVAPRWILLLLWLVYLSFVGVGGVFLGYQWDMLLLEAAFFSAWYAPGGLWLPAARRAPSFYAVFLVRWLLFRLMWLSGWVKVVSDVHWRNLTALDYHFWTQPLPTAAGWWLAHAPPAVLHTLCAGALALELVVPLLIFGPRRLRRLAFAALVLLQLSIAVTGNYGFFNLLTLALCLPLLEDSAAPAPRLWFGPWRSRSRELWPWALTAVAVLITGLVSLRRFSRAPLARPILSALAPFDTFNAYGLFAVMTTERDEISLEGSADGKSWRPYRFPWKPDAPDHALGLVAPMQPRLDWQMWFAALGSCQDNPWFLLLSERLLQGSAPVRGLFAADPFPQTPPRYLRSTLDRFTPASLDEHRRTGASWDRQALGPFCPTVQLDSRGGLALAPPALL